MRPVGRSSSNLPCAASTIVRSARGPTTSTGKWTCTYACHRASFCAWLTVGVAGLAEPAPQELKASAARSAGRLARTSSRYPVAQHPDPLDLELDLVAWLKPAAVAMLEDAATADGAGADHVPGDQTGGVAGGGLEQLLPGEVHAAGARVGAHLAVDARDRAHVEVTGQLAGRDEHRTQCGCEVLALGGSEADLHLERLEIARGEVVHDREPLRAPVGADHARQLELVIERLRVARLGDHVAVAVDRVGVGEVEDRDLVPRAGNLEPARRPRVADVLLEGHEVADRGSAADGVRASHQR